MRPGVRYKSELEELRAEAREARLERPEGPVMYALIDTTNHRAIARHASYKALAALHYIQFANVDATIIGEGLNRSWAQFPVEALLDILASVEGKLGPHCYAYNDILALTRQTVERSHWLICPYDAGALIRQACSISPDDTKPRKFDPDGDATIVVKQWTMPPERSERPRRESSYSTGFLNQGRGEDIGLDADDEPPVRAPNDAASGSRGERTRTPRALKAPRATRTPDEVSKGRPAAHSKTGMVWGVADRIRAANKKASGKALRNLVIDACIAEGINKGTASVQFGKWKAANGI